MTVAEILFTKHMLVGQSLLKNFCTELCLNPTKDLVADTRLQRDKRRVMVSKHGI